MSKPVRVRIAPSPTGHLHVGVARTAILNWLFARHHQGKFIVRIEDTDQARSSQASEDMILHDLRWLGLNWDEGPDKGGEFGPYHQMKRLHLYEQVAQEMITRGAAFRCFVQQDDIDANREKALAESASTVFRSPYRDAPPSVWEAKLAAGEKPSIRLRVPDAIESVTVPDRIKGDTVFKAETLPDFVLLRSNGVPSYNFAVVVDDALMQISHVIRGDDHLTNTPKQMLIYQAMGWELPVFAHVPMILGGDRSKLSKRHGSVSIGQFMAEGYLPHAIVNFLSLLGWSSETQQELLALDELIAQINLDRISSSAAVFDQVKLNWMNGHYIRQLSEADYVRLATPYLQQAGYPATDDAITTKVLLSVREKVETLSQVVNHTKIYFDPQLTFENEDARAIAQSTTSRQIFATFCEELSRVTAIDTNSFREIMKSVQKITGIKGKELWIPIRVGLTGQVHGPDLGIIVEVLGREKCLERVRQAS